MMIIGYDCRGISKTNGTVSEEESELFCTYYTAYRTVTQCTNIIICRKILVPYTAARCY